jgi:hypothetical protein
MTKEFRDDVILEEQTIKGYTIIDGKEVLLFTVLVKQL